MLPHAGGCDWDLKDASFVRRLHDVKALWRHEDGINKNKIAWILFLAREYPNSGDLSLGKSPLGENYFQIS